MFYFLVRWNQVQLDQIWSRFFNRKFNFRFIGKKSNSRTFISSILLHSNFHTRAIIFHSLSFEVISGPAEQSANRLPVSISGSRPAGNLKILFFESLPKMRLQVISYFWPRTNRWRVNSNLKNPTWLSLTMDRKLPVRQVTTGNRFVFDTKCQNCFLFLETDKSFFHQNSRCIRSEAIKLGY